MTKRMHGQAIALVATIASGVFQLTAAAGPGSGPYGPFGSSGAYGGFGPYSPYVVRGIDPHSPQVVAERVITTTVIRRRGRLPAVGERMITSQRRTVTITRYSGWNLPPIMVEEPVIVRITPTPVGELLTVPGPTTAPFYSNWEIDYSNPYR